MSHHLSPLGGGGVAGYSREVWVEASPGGGPQTLTQFKTKVVSFSTFVRQETIFHDPRSFRFAYTIK